MAFLTSEELKTHLYKENIETIARTDETLVMAAIDAAIQEAYGYLGAYDRTMIFTAEGSARNALLLIFVKDIAVWHFVNICNAGTDLQLRQDRYERAISWLRSVQRSETKPDLPVAYDAVADGTSSAPAGEYIFGSNPKRHQQF